MKMAEHVSIPNPMLRRAETGHVYSGNARSIQTTGAADPDSNTNTHPPQFESEIVRKDQGMMPKSPMLFDQDMTERITKKSHPSTGNPHFYDISEAPPTPSPIQDSPDSTQNTTSLSHIMSTSCQDDNHQPLDEATGTRQLDHEQPTVYTSPSSPSEMNNASPIHVHLKDDEISQTPSTNGLVISQQPSYSERRMKSRAIMGFAKSPVPRVYSQDFPSVQGGNDGKKDNSSKGISMPRQDQLRPLTSNPQGHDEAVSSEEPLVSNRNVSRHQQHMSGTVLSRDYDEPVATEKPFASSDTSSHQHYRLGTPVPTSRPSSPDHDEADANQNDSNGRPKGIVTTHNLRDNSMAALTVNRFDQCELLTLRHGLMALVQGESFRRQRMEEDETKIRHLVASLSDIEKERDTLRQRLKQQQGDYDTSMAESKRSMDEAIARMEMDKHYTKMLNTRKEEQSDALRKEATKLQLLNYRQEQKIQELEAKVASQENVTCQTMTQWVECQKKLADLNKLYNSTAATVKRLEESVDNTREMTRRFNVIRRQSEYELKIRDREIEELKQKLTASDAQCQQSLRQMSQMEVVTTQLNAALNTVKQLEACKVALQAELRTQTDEVQKYLTRVSADQQLVERYLTRATKYQHEVDHWRTQYKDSVADVDSLTDKVQSLEKQIRDNQRLLKDQERTWQKEMDMAKENLKAKIHELDSVHETNETLEEANHQLAIKNQKLSQSLEDAEAIMNVPKADVSIQVGPSVYLMIGAGVQVCPDTSSVAVQSRTLTYTCYSQTDHNFKRSSTGAQTDSSNLRQETRHWATQTIRKVLVNKGCGETLNATTAHSFNRLSLLTANSATQTKLSSTDTHLKYYRLPGVGGTTKSEPRDKEKWGSVQMDGNRPSGKNSLGRDSGSAAISGPVQTPTSDTSESNAATSSHHSLSDWAMSGTGFGGVYPRSAGTSATSRRWGGDKEIVKTLKNSSLVKGILKDPSANKGKGTKSRSVNFPDALETRFLISPNPSSASIQSRRSSPSNSPKSRKSPLQMVTSTTPSSACRSFSPSGSSSGPNANLAPGRNSVSIKQEINADDENVESEAPSSNALSRTSLKPKPNIELEACIKELEDSVRTSDNDDSTNAISPTPDYSSTVEAPTSATTTTTISHPCTPSPSDGGGHKHRHRGVTTDHKGQETGDIAPCGVEGKLRGQCEEDLQAPCNKKAKIC